MPKSPVKRKVVAKKKPAKQVKTVDKGLNEQQKLFALEYIVDFNGKQAAIRAKYGAKTAEQQASRLLSQVKVQQEVSKNMEIRRNEVKVDANYVLNRLIEIDHLDIMDIMTDDLAVKPLSDWPDVWRRNVTSIETIEEFAGHGKEREHIGYLKKIKLPDKVKNLELLGKHIDVQAWKEKPEIEVNVHMTIEALAKQIAQERLVN